MTDQSPGTPPAVTSDIKTMTMLVYILSLAGVVTGGLTSLIALILGLVKKSEATGTLYESHLEFANRTNIICLVASLAIGIVGAVLAIILIGFLIWALGYLALFAWYITRMVVGLLKLNEGQPYPTPQSWLL